MKQQKKGYFSGETNKEIFAKKNILAPIICVNVLVHILKQVQNKKPF